MNPCFNSNIKSYFLSTQLVYTPHYFTFHSFTRSGASLTFASHVQLQQIKLQGTWLSVCVWEYFHTTADNANQVASKFARLYSL